MSYILYTFKNRDDQDIEQWNDRDLETEIQSYETRTIVPVFEQFIINSMKLIEAGCGLGGWVHYFSQKGNDIIGIEYDKRIVEKAKSFDSNINVINGDVNQLAYSDNSFDGYISLGVIEHFQYGPQKALLEAKRLIKPDGLMFLTVPLLTQSRRLFAHPLRNLYLKIYQLKGKSKYFGEYRYSKKELLSFLEACHFEVIYIGVDDYSKADRKRHIGLYADYFFLRQKRGKIWELNKIGMLILQIFRLFPPWFFCSGILVVAKNKK